MAGSEAGEGGVATTSTAAESINGVDTSSTTPNAPKRVSSPGKLHNAQTPVTPSKRSKDTDESLFGGDEGRSDDMELERDLNEALGLGLNDSQARVGDSMVGMDDGEELQVPDRPSNANGGKDKEASKDKERDADSEGDSLFGGESADGDADADADGEADLDAEGEEEDADGEDDDEPLAARLNTHTTIGGLELPGPSAGASQSPSRTKTDDKQTSEASSADPRRKALPKPAFGGHEVAAGFDGDVSRFSNDVLLTSTLGGQVTLWDKRVPSYAGETSLGGPTYKGVRALALPDKTPPWCMSACWDSRGEKIYVGRRNETIDEWDLRMLPDASSNQDNGAAPTRRGNARFARSLRFPHGSGPVTAVAGMPNSRHLVCGSHDNVRMWDTQAIDSKIPFRIVAGHHGATVSQIIVDPTARFLFTSSGDRGWMSSSTETILLHEIQGL